MPGYESGGHGLDEVKAESGASVSESGLHGGGGGRDSATAQKDEGMLARLLEAADRRAADSERRVERLARLLEKQAEAQRAARAGAAAKPVAHA